jgi:hypothetical protein
MLVGYMRVSTDGDRRVMGLQRDALLAAGVEKRHLTKINGRTFWGRFGTTSVLLRIHHLAYGGGKTNEHSLALIRGRVSACPLGKCQFGVWPDARADALPHELSQ